MYNHVQNKKMTSAHVAYWDKILESS